MCNHSEFHYLFILIFFPVCVGGKPADNLSVVPRELAILSVKTGSLPGLELAD